VCDVPERHLGVVDRFVKAEFTEHLMLAGPGGSQRVGTASLGDLHGQVSDPADGGVDEHPVRGSDTAVSTRACQAVSAASSWASC
jgi:hypothetical protein